MITGCHTCWGTFWGPVGTARETFSSILELIVDPGPPATGIYCAIKLFAKKTPSALPNVPGALAARISDPVIFLISSRPQAPAVPSAPSTQFRKRARLFENSIGLNGFSAGLRPFRNWALGQSADAGAWKADSFRSHTHSGVYVSSVQTSAGTGNSLHLARNTGDSAATGGVETAPQHIWQPIILYLGRPR